MINVVVPVWNGSKYTRACLESIARTYSGDELRVIVIDDCSTDDTQEVLGRIIAARKLPMLVERNDVNIGFARSCNRGLMACQEDLDGVIIWLNNDTECIDRLWAPTTVDRLLRNTDIGVVGALLWYPSNANPHRPGRVQHAGLAFVSKDHMLHLYRGMKPQTAPGILREKCVQAVTGAFFAMRVRDAVHLGGFCEDYTNGFEDLDLCFRVRRDLNKRVLYCPEVQLIHHESVSGAKRFEKDRENYELFLSRWRDRVGVDFDQTLLDDGGVAIRL